MATILETLKKFNVPVPDDILIVTAEDLPYLMFATLMPGPNKEQTTFALLIGMAIRIEQLENEVFSLKWKEGDSE